MRIGLRAGEYYPLVTRLMLPHGLANAIIFPYVLAFCAKLGIEMSLAYHGARAGGAG